MLSYVLTASCSLIALDTKVYVMYQASSEPISHTVSFPGRSTAKRSTYSTNYWVILR